MNIADIQSLAQVVHEANSDLVNALREYDAEVALIRDAHLGEIKAFAEAFAVERERLIAAIEGNGQLFARPRSQTVQDVQFGVRKQKGRIEIKDEERTIALLRKHFGKKAEDMITTREAVSKSALAALDASELKRIGVAVVADTEEPFVKIAASDAAKMAEAIIKEAAA